MTQRLNAWCDEAWATVRDIPDGIGSKLHTRWSAHAFRDHIVLTLFGPYDSGKSSLLKRLLVDDGQPVPDWLTISGRPETFETNEVFTCGVVVRDTPGIAGGEGLHEEIVSDALLLSDVIALVISPQLITSDRDKVFSILDGSSFGCSMECAFANGGLPIILSRMDDAGIMPLDDMRGYHRLIEQKRKEIADMLRSIKATDYVVAVHPLAADPFGSEAYGQATRPENYDTNRDWDGVAEFKAYLKNLLARKDVLRKHAEVRFLGAEIKKLCASFDDDLLETKARAAEASRQVTIYEQLQQRLQALFNGARADLERRIEEEIAAVSRRGDANPEDLRKAVLERVQETLDHWEKAHDAELNVLIRDADLEFEQRRRRSGGTGRKSIEVLATPVSEVSQPAAAKGARRLVDDRAQKAAKVLRDGHRQALPNYMGMSVAKMREELAELDRAGSFKKYAEEAKRRRIKFRDPAHADRARWASRGDVALSVVPAIMEVLHLVFVESKTKMKAARRKAQHRKEVKRDIETLVKTLSDQTWKLWRDEGMPGAVQTALTAARCWKQGVVASLRSEEQLIGSHLSSLKRVLEDLENVMENDAPPSACK